jgi:hypothetical protein
MTRYAFNLSLAKPEELRKTVHEKVSSNLFIRDKLSFLNKYIDLVEAGTKKTTIRFRRGMVDVPAKTVIPVFLTDSGLHGSDELAGWARINKLRIVSFSELSEVDALNDGFTSLADLKKALSDIYGEIDKTDFISIYEFEYLQKG